jgi:3-hydroxyisobutyrate dehydrogenase-like beta-hydroxyacid dehydrogenase
MSYHHLTIGLIGGGNMSRALVRGLLRSGHPAQLISIAEPDAGQREQLAALDPGLVLDANNTPVAQNAAVLVLAVKPQILPAVATALAGRPVSWCSRSQQASRSARWQGGSAPTRRWCGSCQISQQRSVPVYLPWQLQAR